MFFGRRIPPIDKIAILIELTANIIEAMRYFMTDDRANGPVIHVFWSIVAEQSIL